MCDLELFSKIWSHNYCDTTERHTKVQEFSDFDPTVEPEDTWNPPGSMISDHIPREAFQPLFVERGKEAIL